MASPVQTDKLLKATSQCIERWLSPHYEPPSSTLNELAQMVYRDASRYARHRSSTPSLSTKDGPRCPLPNRRGCLEFSVRQGGVTRRLRNLSALCDQIGYPEVGAPPEPPAILPVVIKTDTPFLSKEQEEDNRVMYHYEVVNKAVLQARKEGRTKPPGPGGTPFTTLRAFQTARFISRDKTEGITALSNGEIGDTEVYIPEVKPVAIWELGEKCRVASLHPAALSHYARCFAENTLPFLKSQRVFGRVLRGQNIDLTGKKGALLYSEDLSAASDYISHSYLQVLHALGAGLGLPQQDHEAIDNTLRSYKIVGMDQSTTMGAHMGLGTTWTLLCLLNLYAARQAAPDASFAICGDDLIGLWTSEQVQSYKDHIHILGLRLNEPKSFYGRHGVFCEALVSMTSDTTARGRCVAKISEVTCPKGRPGIAQRADLERISISHSPKPLRRAAMTTLKRTEHRGVPKGPAFLGCQGGRASDKLALPLLHHALKRGPMRVKNNDDDAIRAITAEAIKNAERESKPGHNVAISEYLLTARCKREYDRVANAPRIVAAKKAWLEWVPDTSKVAAEEEAARLHAARKWKTRWSHHDLARINVKGWLSLIRSSQHLTSRAKSILRTYFLRSRHRTDFLRAARRSLNYIQRVGAKEVYCPSSLSPLEAAFPLGSDYCQSGKACLPRWATRGSN